MTEGNARESIGAALARIPQGLFVLTARHEDRRTGMVASFVQQACFTPPMVSVAIAKGRAILPLISESRVFALCQVPRGDKLILRKFGNPASGEDPFLGMDLLPPATTGLPILAGSLSYLECEVACHVDVEGDHDLFVARVRHGRFLSGDPMVRLRENGYKY